MSTYQISLINMPFANLNLPSIALTQLRSVVEAQYGDRVRVRVLYLNQELANYFGLDLYKQLSGELYSSGLGDWLFRSIAFPDEPDNTQAYFARYFPQQSPEVAAMKGKVLAKHVGLERFLGRKVFIKLWVKVVPGWTAKPDQARRLAEAGFKVVELFKQ